MAYNETRVTLTGSVASEVTCTKVGTGCSRANFRMLTRERLWDVERRLWVDGNHMFLSVTCWRDLADNVKASLARHDPVVVAGKLTVKELPEGERYRQFIDVEAYAVGIDLTRCSAAITKPQAPPDTTPATATPPDTPARGKRPAKLPETDNPATPPTAAGPPAADPPPAAADPPAAGQPAAATPAAGQPPAATDPPADSPPAPTAQSTPTPTSAAPQPAVATPRKEGGAPRTRPKTRSPLKEVDKVPF
ncbi:Single-stranded DNA-binding protein [Actinosynnema sp. ALI-1.44]